MSAETDIYSALSGSTAVTNISGSRIYADVRDEGDGVPAIVYERTGTLPYVSLHTGETFAETATMEVLCIAKDRETAEDLRDKVMAAAIAAADFIYQDRGGSYDPDADLFISILTLNHNWSA